MPKPYAAFDIDGTLIRWQLYHAVADQLVKMGHISEDAFKVPKAARMQWKKRSNPDSFEEYQSLLVETYGREIQHIKHANVMQAMHQVFDEYKDQTYTYTRDLIRSLKAEGYLLFAISASQSEIVTMLAEYYGFNAAVGSEYETVDGVFTGHVNVLKSNRKPEAIQKLIKQYGATTEGSIAVGDSISDIPMLASVERPIAFNPDRGLFETARANGWKVAVERKNMTYEFEYRDGTYVLNK